jgi:hypothetical protein
MKFEQFNLEEKSEDKEKSGEAKADSLKEAAVSENEHKIVESIEQLPMSDYSKQDLLLTWRGEKLATDIRITLGTWHVGETKPKITEEDKKRTIEQAESVLHSMGVFWVDGESDERDPYVDNTDDGKSVEIPGSITKVIYVSPIKENAEKLEKLWSEKDEVKNARDIGAMYGFSPSAVESYGQFFEQGYHKGFKNREMTIEKEELPKEIQDQDFMAFAQFRLSKNNWQEELLTAKKWAEVIKTTDPDLYRRIVEFYKNRPSIPNHTNR